MIFRYVLFCAAAAVLAGCATAPEPWAGPADGPRGYWYHDSVHSNVVVSPSPQAIENAKRGVWLWPPTERSSR